MLQRIANMIIGGIILTMSGCMLAAHLTSREPLQLLVLVLACAQVFGAAACLRAALAADAAEPGPALPTARDAAAGRLRELKRAAAPHGLRRVRRPVGALPHVSTRAQAI
jgi:hypothetical protein